MEDPDFSPPSVAPSLCPFIDAPVQGFDFWRAVSSMVAPAHVQALSAVSPALRLVMLGTIIKTRKSLHGARWWWRQLPAVKVHLYNPLPEDTDAAFTQLRIDVLRIDVTPLQTMRPVSQPIAAVQAEHLRKIDFNGSANIGDRHLEWFPLYVHVTTVRLIGCDGVGNDGLTFLSEMRSLEVLVIGGCVATDAGLEALGRSPRLRALALHGCDGITSKGVCCLATIPTLTQLVLASLGQNATKAVPAALATGRNNCLPLTRLRLQFDMFKTEDITSILSMVFLEHLSLSARIGSIPPGCLETIGGLRELRSLQLREQSLDDTALHHIATLPRLQLLEISYNRSITDAGFAALGTLSKLHCLRMEGLALLTDEIVVPVLASMPLLQRLVMHGCKLLTDAVLDVLPLMRHLRFVGLRGCHKISLLAVDQVTYSHRHTISREPGSELVVETSGVSCV